MHRIRLIALAALLPSFVLVGATPGPETPIPARKLGKTQKIKKYGYSIRIPDRWTAVPNQPGETKVVGKWEPDPKEVEKKWDVASYGCELTVVRFAATSAVTGQQKEEEEEKKKDEPKIPDELRKFMGKKFGKAKTLEGYLESNYEGARKRCLPKTIKAGSGKRKLQGELLEFTKGSSYVVAALFEETDWHWGVFYEAREDYYVKEWKKLYGKSLKSFRVFEPEGKVYSVADGVDTKSLKGDKKREAIKAGIAGSPGWWAHDTKNYVFLTNTKKKSLISQLGKEIETIRAKVYEKYFPPTNTVDAICIVRVFSDESEYYQYGGPRGSAGYWSSAKEELVLFDGFSGVSKVKSVKFTKSVMYHEAFHQYIYYAVGDLAPHSWFNEGHGDFFAGMSVKGSNVSFKKFSWRVNYLKRHLSLRKNLIPIRSLVRLPQREYYSNAGLKYAQGWALIYYLRKVTKNKEWRAIPDRYFKHLRDNLAAFKKSGKDKDDDSGEGVPGIPGVKVSSFVDREKVDEILEAAVDKGFEGVDYEKLDAAFLKWVKAVR